MVFIPQYQQQTSAPFAGGGEVPVDDQIGRAVEGFGAQTRQAAGEMLDLDDHVAAQAAQGRTTTKIRELVDGAPGKPGLKDLKGAEAVVRAPQVLAEIQQIRADEMKGLKTGGARRLYGQMADDRLEAATATVTDLARQADHKAKSDIYDGGIDLHTTGLSTALFQDPAQADVELKSLRTAIHGKVALEGNGDDASRQIAEDKLFADAVLQVMNQRGPGEALRVLDALLPDHRAPFYGSLRQMALGRSQGAAAAAIVRGDDPAGWWPTRAPPAASDRDAPPRKGDIDEHGMETWDRVQARARRYEAAWQMSPEERADFDAQTLAAYRQRRTEKIESQNAALERYGQLAKNGGKPGDMSLMEVFLLPPAIRKLAMRFVAQGGPPGHDHSAAKAAAQLLLALDPKRFVEAFPPALILGLSHTTTNRLKALRETGREGGDDFHAAVAGARLAENVGRNVLMQMTVHPDEPRGTALRADLGRWVEGWILRHGEPPGLKDTRQKAIELAATPSPADEAQAPDHSSGYVDGLGRRLPDPLSPDGGAPALTEVGHYVPQETHGPPYEVSPDSARRIVFNETASLSDMPDEASDDDLVRKGLESPRITVQNARTVLAEVVVNRAAAGVRGGMEDDTLDDDQQRNIKPGGYPPALRAWESVGRAIQEGSDPGYQARMPGATNFLMGDTYDAVAGRHFRQPYTWVLGPFKNNDPKHPVRYIGIYGPNPPTSPYFW